MPPPIGTSDLIATAVALADVLARENSALTELDLAGAAALLDAKTAAAGAFQAAQQQAVARGPLAASQRTLAEQVGTRLRDLADENKRLLERAIQVQGRVLATIAKVLPRVLPHTTRYGATGALANPRRSVPISMSARV